VIVNFLFKKKEDHLVTFKSGTSKTKIDHFLTGVRNRRLCKDCKVISRKYLGTRHMLLVMDVEIKGSREKKRSGGSL